MKKLKTQKILYHASRKHLLDYNKVSSKPMDLVIFGYAAEHLSRLVRILIMKRDMLYWLA